MIKNEMLAIVLQIRLCVNIIFVSLRTAQHGMIYMHSGIVCILYVYGEGAKTLIANNIWLYKYYMHWK